MITTGLAVGGVLIASVVGLIVAFIVGVFLMSVGIPTDLVLTAGAFAMACVLIGSTIAVAHGATATYRWSIVSNRRGVGMIGLAILGACLAQFPSARATNEPTKSASWEARPSPTSTTITTKDVFGECMTTLQTDEEQKGVRWFARHYPEIPGFEAHDLVRDAMLRVCILHERSQYTKIGAAFQVAIERGALDWEKHEHVKCSAVEVPITCPPSPDESARLGCELRVADQALCGESRDDQAIIRFKIVKDEDFETIGKRFDLSADQAKDHFHNSMKRVQRRVGEVLNAK